MIYRYEKVTNYDKVLHNIGVVLFGTIILIGSVVCFVYGLVG